MSDITSDINCITKTAETKRLLVDGGCLPMALLTPFGLSGAFGMARIRSYGTRFEFQEDGQEVVAFAWREPSVEDYQDVVAFNFSRPEHAWTRYGVASILGDDALLKAIACQEPIRIRRTVLDWLRADLNGICVIDWKAAWWRLRGARLVVEDYEHGRELERRLRAPDPELPNIALINKVFIPASARAA